MKKLSIFLITFVFFLFSNLYAFSSDPKEFVTELVGEAINKLSDKNLTEDDWRALTEQVKNMKKKKK